MDFDTLFDASRLPWVLKQAKTLSKSECFGIFEYMQKYKPVNIMEFGVQYGCSTSVFLEIAKWLGYKITLNSWDISDSVRCVDKEHFCLHIEDITGKEEKVIKSYRPDLIFLDAHPYILTKNLVSICLDSKIDFACHDVSFDIIDSLRTRSNGFKHKDFYAAWEPYVLSELISPKILTDNHYEDDKVIVTCIRDKYGLAIIEHK